MREIKFRAWDNKTKTMFMLTHYSWMSNPNENDRFEGFLLSGYEEGMHKTLKPDVTLLQYTGLKDKHGKEIYEGDIVNLDIDGEFMDGHRLSPDFKDPFVVEEKEGCFECKFIEGEKETFPISEYWQASNDLEVIGNRFQNPELLK